VDSGDVLLDRHAEFLELGCVVVDAVLIQGLLHIEDLARTLPGVTGGVAVDIQVAVEDLIHSFLLAALDLVVVPRQGVDNAHHSHLRRQGTNDKTVVLPPGQIEILFGVPV
jgi:hypothetical protein